MPDASAAGEAYRLLQAEARWEPIDQPAAADVRVGIMGMGVLGQDSAEVLKRLGFRVAGWSRSAKVGAGCRNLRRRSAVWRVSRPHGYPRRAATADAETRGILNRNLLASSRAMACSAGRFW